MYFLERNMYLINFDLKQLSSGFFHLVGVSLKNKTNKTKQISQKRYIWLFLRGD